MSSIADLLTRAGNDEATSNITTQMSSALVLRLAGNAKRLGIPRRELIARACVDACDQLEAELGPPPTKGVVIVEEEAEPVAAE